MISNDNGPAVLEVDHKEALEWSTARLAEEFGRWFDAETIERWLRSSYDEVAEGATVTTYLPLLAERFTRERLKDARNRQHVSI